MRKQESKEREMEGDRGEKWREREEGIGGRGEREIEGEGREKWRKRNGGREGIRLSPWPHEHS